MKRSAFALACALAGFMLALPHAQPLPRPPSPDLVLFNGKVIAVDSDFSISQAVAIIGDRIMAVGTDDQMRTVAGPATRMIDGSTLRMALAKSLCL